MRVAPPRDRVRRSNGPSWSARRRYASPNVNEPVNVIWNGRTMFSQPAPNNAKNEGRAGKAIHGCHTLRRMTTKNRAAAVRQHDHDVART